MQRKGVGARWRLWCLAACAVLCVFALLGSVAMLGVNGYVVSKTKDRMIEGDELAAGTVGQADCILILGCRVFDDGRPSHMLEDRLKQGIALYFAGVAPKLLLSGDHGSDDYDEVTAMKNYAVAAGVPAEDIFLDHAGFSTYDSLWRAKEVFGVESVVVVTQRYHLYRALYLADALDMDAVGVPADLRTYAGQIVRDAREVLARCKDFLLGIFLPRASVAGDAIPLTGDGRVTHEAKAGEIACD